HWADSAWRSSPCAWCLPFASHELPSRHVSRRVVVILIVAALRRFLVVFPRAGMHAHAFAFPIKRRRIDSENLRRFTEARRAHDDALDVLRLEFFERRF